MTLNNLDQFFFYYRTFEKYFSKNLENNKKYAIEFDSVSGKLILKEPDFHRQRGN